jgi:hypothetical protein
MPESEDESSRFLPLVLGNFHLIIFAVPTIAVAWYGRILRAKANHRQDRNTLFKEPFQEIEDLRKSERVRKSLGQGPKNSNRGILL